MISDGFFLTAVIVDLHQGSHISIKAANQKIYEQG